MYYENELARGVDDLYNTSESIRGYKLDELREHFNDVLERLYSYTSLDTEELHHSIKKMTEILDVYMPETEEPLIERKG